MLIFRKNTILQLFMQGTFIITSFSKNIYKLFGCLMVSGLLLSCGGGGSDSSANVPVAITPVETPPVDLEPSNGYTAVTLQSTITKAKPMSGIVLWDTHQVWSSANKLEMADAISLEFSYIDINKIVTAEGVYDWSYLESKLEKISARNHQAVFRLYYVFPGRETTVPDYIKSLPDYNETIGETEGLTTYFPDWTNAELQSFTKKFHTKFSEKYNNDVRIAFLQVGFGLWGEYHIYDGPKLLNETFPSKTYQAEFLEHLNSIYTVLPWSISIDAFNEADTPIIDNNFLLSLDFGLFDDSFMQEQHSGYNENAWNAFDYTERYKTTVFGGEFSYQDDSDQLNVLIPNEGAYGISYEEFTDKFHMSYVIGNDTYTRGLSNEQPISRIQEASIYSGYTFNITAFSTNDVDAEVVVENTGVAPIYYDAYVTVNGIRSKESLKGLLPNTSQKFIIESGGVNPVLTIESDHILPTQTIEYNADL